MVRLEINYLVFQMFLDSVTVTERIVNLFVLLNCALLANYENHFLSSLKLIKVDDVGQLILVKLMRGDGIRIKERPSRHQREAKTKQKLSRLFVKY